MSSAKRFITSITRYSSSAYHVSTRVLASNSSVIGHHGLSPSLGYRYLTNYTRRQQFSTRKFSVKSGVEPGAPLPPQPPSSSWRWLLGIVLTAILPFVGNKFGPFLQYKQEVDSAVEMIEEIVEVVEKVAKIVDTVAEDISGDLPEGGKLKNVLGVVEDLAEKTAEDAHAVGDAIDKFQEVEAKIEDIVGTRRQ